MAVVTRYPSTDTAVSGTWVTPTNVQADDGAVAAITRGTTKNSQDDREQGGYGFDAAIAAGATINSVQIEVEHRVATTSNVCFLENFARITTTDGAVNSDSTEPTTLTALTYPSYARPGGGGWTRDDLLDGTFKTLVRARNGNNATSNTWEWDYIRVTVDYTVSSPVLVTPGVASLTTATFAPTVTATNNKLVTPGVASLTTAAFAPTVTATQHQLVTPGVASLVLASFAPTVSGGSGTTVTPGTATLTLTAFAPTVLAPRLVTPGIGSLTLTAFAPTVTATAHVTVTPATASLVLTGFAPTVTGGAGLTVTPGVASLSLTAFAPTVTTTANITLTPGLAALLLSGFAPVVTASDHKTVTPGTATLTLSAFAPSVLTPRLVIPGTAVLALATFIPTVTTGGVVVFSGGPGPQGLATYTMPRAAASSPKPEH